jgi:hypothetical protein
MHGLFMVSEHMPFLKCSQARDLLASTNWGEKCKRFFWTLFVRKKLFSFDKNYPSSMPWLSENQRNGLSWNGTKYRCATFWSSSEHHTVIIETIPTIWEHSELVTFYASSCDVTSTGQPLWNSAPKKSLSVCAFDCSLYPWTSTNQSMNCASSSARVKHQAKTRPAVRPVLVQRYRTVPIFYSLMNPVSFA